VISRNSIDRILETARIEEVVGDYVTLKKRGGNLLGLCPFHNEKTPSFTVTPTKGIYKCFGCGVAGNAVGFLMAHDQLSYPEALRNLAARYQITIEEDRSNREDPEYLAQKTQRDRLFELMGLAQQTYTRLLWDHPTGSAVGLAYFRERGLSDTTVQRFALGYSLEQSGTLLQMADRHGFGIDELELAGLAAQTESRTAYERFRGRVLFPIHNLSGKVIAFGGRTLKTEAKEAKYINSPETPLYRKGENLYGLFQARKSMSQTGHAYLVEGYMDVISLSQSGIENVVASSGTALTTEQARLLQRFVGEVTLIYDGDTAGIKAALRGIDLLLENGLNLRVVALPAGEDPDSLARRLHGSGLADWLASHSKDFMAFQQELLLTEAGNDPIQRSKALQVMAGSIACVRDPLLQATYIQQMSATSGLPSGSIQEAVNQHLQLKAKRALTASKGPDLASKTSGDATVQADLPPTVVPTAPNQTPSLGDLPQESQILRLLVEAGDLVHESKSTMIEYMADTLQSLPWEHPHCYELFQYCLHSWQSHRKIPTTHQLLQHQNAQISAMVTQWLVQTYQVSPNWDLMHDIQVQDPAKNQIKELEACFDRLILKKIIGHRQQKVLQLKELQNLKGPEIQEEVSLDTQLKLLNEIQDLKKTEAQLTHKTGIVITH